MLLVHRLGGLDLGLPSPEEPRVGEDNRQHLAREDDFRVGEDNLRP